MVLINTNAEEMNLNTKQGQEYSLIRVNPKTFTNTSI